MFLYRALLKEEYVLSSNPRAFITDINLLDEVYSHIVKTYTLEDAKKRKIVYSFTDDINIAITILNKNNDYYDKIGYIDINELGLINQDEIKFVYPIFEYDNWINLAAYSIDDIEKIKVKCVNYNSSPINLIETLVPSHSGALSWARGAREYVIICQNLQPIIISKEDLDTEKMRLNKIIKAGMINDEKNKKIIMIDKLLEEADKLNIQDTRKKILKKELNRIKKI